DFAVMAIAAERALKWTPGSAINAYRNNIIGGARNVIEKDSVAVAITDLLAREGGRYVGRISDLYRDLDRITDPNTKLSREWPKTPNWLSNSLSRLAPAMAMIGINIKTGDHTKRGTIVTITTTASTKSEPVTQGDASDAISPLLTLSSVEEKNKKEKERGSDPGTGSGRGVERDNKDEIASLASPAPKPEENISNINTM